MLAHPTTSNSIAGQLVCGLAFQAFFVVVGSLKAIGANEPPPPWPRRGDILMPRHASVPLHVSPDPSSATLPLFNDNQFLSFLSTRGEWYQTDHEGAWVHKDDVIRARDAPQFYHAAIRRNPSAFFYCQLALSYWLEGFPERVLPNFENAIHADPVYLRAVDWRARFLDSQERWDEEIEDLTLLIKSFPLRKYLYFRRASAWDDLKQYQRAINDLDKTIECDPLFEDAYYNRALALQSLNEHQRAISDFGRVIEISPGNAHALVKRAFERIAIKEYDGAVNDCRRARCVARGFFEAPYIEGIAESLGLRFDRAIDAFSKALELRPDEPDVYASRAAAYAMCGDLDLAITDCDHALRLAPRHTAALANRASAWLLKQDMEKCLADCSQALQIDEKCIHALLTRARAHILMHDPRHSIDDCTTAISLQDDNVIAYALRGLARLRIGDESGALDDENKAVKVDENRYEGWLFRGKVWQSLGQNARAASDFARAIHINRQSEDAQAAFAWFWATCKDPAFRDGKLAVKAATKACELSKWRQAAHLDVLAAALAECGDFDGALRRAREALRHAVKDPAVANGLCERIRLYTKKIVYRSDGPLPYYW